MHRSALPLFLRSVGAQAQAESKGFRRLKECIIFFANILLPFVSDIKK